MQFNSQVEDNHFEQFSGHAPLEGAQDAVNLHGWQGIMLADVQLTHPPGALSPFPQSCSPTTEPRPLSLQGALPSQVLTAFILAESHQIPGSPFFQCPCVPLNGKPPRKSISFTASTPPVCCYPESVWECALSHYYIPSSPVTLKDIKKVARAQ